VLSHGLGVPVVMNIDAVSDFAVIGQLLLAVEHMTSSKCHMSSWRWFHHSLRRHFLHCNPPWDSFTFISLFTTLSIAIMMNDSTVQLHYTV